MSNKRKRNRNVAADEATQVVEGEATEAQAEGETKVAKPRKALADQGRGNPGARKVINPQPTLELKKKHIRAAGGSMEFKNRQWEIEVNGEEHVFPSKVLAGMTLGQLCAAVGVDLQA